MRYLAALAALLFSVSAFAFTESITVTWNDPGTEDSFQLQRSNTVCAGATGSTWSTVASPAQDVTSYNDTVQDDATYCYKVRAFKDGVFGPFSNTIEVAVPASLAALVINATLD